MKHKIVIAVVIAATVLVWWWPRRRLSPRNWFNMPSNFGRLTPAQQDSYDAALTHAAAIDGSKYE